MRIDISPSEAEVLAEILSSALTQLRFEIARSDNREFRERLVARAELLERMIDHFVLQARAIE